MASTVLVQVHPSQFPAAVRRDLVASLHARAVNPKFLYDSVKQTQQWLALHQAYSPSRTDAACRATYVRSFAAAARLIRAGAVHVVGLGCGGGRKDAQLLRRLRGAGKQVFYTPCDVSLAMVLVARQSVRRVLPPQKCFPLVCDLTTAEDLPDVLAQTERRGRVPAQAARLVTFFGMLPNFELRQILPQLARLIRPQDVLLVSANLAPGPDYAAGMRQILPQYDNPLTRQWLMTFLLDLGVTRTDGQLKFAVEDGPAGLKRVVARFEFTRTCAFRVDTAQFRLTRGDSLRLFFSYRYTPGRVGALLAQQGLTVTERWVTPSGEEGVYLCQRHDPHGRPGAPAL